jgi:hypothetical protein
MSTVSTDALFRLIQSLSKAEKRSFKLFANRNSSSVEELKFLKLFDFMDKSEAYSDDDVFKKLPEIKKSQLSNLKAHLFKQVLGSLRLQHASHLPTLEIHESIDYAQILHHKGFYMQALKQLDKAKQMASKHESIVLQLEIAQLEKSIESQYITRSLPTRAEQLTSETVLLENRLEMSVKFSNLSLQLYALYVKVGFVRNEKDYLFVTDFFKTRLPHYTFSKLGFEEKLHLYNAQVWHHYITQDFLRCYRYASKWVDCFTQAPDAQEQYYEMYLKGLHYLQNSVFNLRNAKRLERVVGLLEAETRSSYILDQENTKLLRELYWITGKINTYYLTGSFADGVDFVDEVEDFIAKYEGQLDQHRIMVLYYKVACLYFGSGDYKMTIRYLNQVIQMKEVSLREDIQCFARILNLIAHFELNNDDLIQYQLKSFIRFLINMGDMHGVQREILSFLRQPAFIDESARLRGFKILHGKLVKLSQLPFEKRPFLYLDIISWLESRIQGRTVQAIIREKFLKEEATGEYQYFPND